MAQDEVVVVRIDVAKDKRMPHSSPSQRGRSRAPRRGRALIRRLRKHKVGSSAMEASGGYEHDSAKARRQARIEVRTSTKAGASFAGSAGRLAKNDPIMWRSSPVRQEFTKHQ